MNKDEIIKGILIFLIFVCIACFGIGYLRKNLHKEVVNTNENNIVENEENNPVKNENVENNDLENENVEDNTIENEEENTVTDDNNEVKVIDEPEVFDEDELINNN